MKGQDGNLVCGATSGPQSSCGVASDAQHASASEEEAARQAQEEVARRGLSEGKTTYPDHSKHSGWTTYICKSRLVHQYQPDLTLRFGFVNEIITGSDARDAGREEGG